MSNGNSSSYIIDTDQSRLEMNSLFSRSNKRIEEVPKPYSARDLPASFYHPPGLKKKSKSEDGQYPINQLSSPNTSLYMTTNHNYVHSRAASDSAALTGHNTMNPELAKINLPSSGLPLPEGWQEQRTADGQIFYIDHFTTTTTWTDPRPSHYVAFRSYCCTLPLPADYMQARDSNGNIYFLDHKNKKTYWDDPRPNHYRSLMTKRLDVPSPIVAQPQENLLATELMKIAKERHALQLRTQELKQMEANIRKKLNQHSNSNTQLSIDKTTIESLIDDLLLHKRQDSIDSGLGDGPYPANHTLDTYTDFPDNLLFPNSSDFSDFSMDIGLAVQNPQATSAMNNSQLNKQPQQRV